MNKSITKAVTNQRAKMFGLFPHDAEKGIYYLKVNAEADNETTLNKMAQLENNGFIYQGIYTRVGEGSFMVFAYLQQIM